MPTLRAQHVIHAQLDTPEHRRQVRRALMQDLSVQLLAYLDAHGPQVVALTWQDRPAPWQNATILTAMVTLTPVGLGPGPEATT